MGRLIEEISLRNKLHVFEDRTEAGSLIAGKLIQYRDSGGIVLGIPSGGVPVAHEIAIALHLPMDLMIVRKLQIPYNPDAGFGAMGLGGEIILNEGLLAQLGLTEDEIREQAEKTKEVIKRRDQVFRGGRPFLSSGRFVSPRIKVPMVPCYRHDGDYIIYTTKNSRFSNEIQNHRKHYDSHGIYFSYLCVGCYHSHRR